MTPKFELGRHFCTMHQSPNFHRHMFTRLEVIVLTNKQTDAAKNIQRSLIATLRRWIKMLLLTPILGPLSMMIYMIGNCVKKILLAPGKHYENVFVWTMNNLKSIRKLLIVDLHSGGWTTLCLKKVPTFKLSVTLSNLNRFSEFLHCWKAYEICYTTHMTLLTSP